MFLTVCNNFCVKTGSELIYGIFDAYTGSACSAAAVCKGIKRITII
jgi:hypothetical protein